MSELANRLIVISNDLLQSTTISSQTFENSSPISNWDRTSHCIWHYFNKIAFVFWPFILNASFKRKKYSYRPTLNVWNFLSLFSLVYLIVRLYTFEIIIIKQTHKINVHMYDRLYHSNVMLSNYL